MPVEIKDLTGGEVKGAGLFDELMRTSKDHLTTEYDEGRLLGAEYAQVYVGVMQSNLQTAANFLLQYELTNAQLLLAQDQLLQSKKQNELLELQKEQLRIANETAQFNLDFIQPEQYANLQEQTKLVTEQKNNAVKQVLLTTQQTAQSVAQTSLVGKQEDLVDEQILDAKDKLLADPIGGINAAVHDKALAEIALLGSRKATEDAQTIGTLTDNGGVLTNTVGGVLGKQMELLYTQKEGFIRDAEQKAAKLQSDAFAIAHSITPESHTPTDYGFGPVESTKVIVKLNAGINVV